MSSTLTFPLPLRLRYINMLRDEDIVTMSAQLACFISFLSCLISIKDGDLDKCTSTVHLPNWKLICTAFREGKENI